MLVIGDFGLSFMYIGFSIIIYYASVVLHELGHYLAYRLIGKEVEFLLIGRNKSKFLNRLLDPELTLKSPIGNFIYYPFRLHGVTVSSEFPNLTSKELRIVIAAGPVMNLLLAIVSSIALYFYLDNSYLIHTSASYFAVNLFFTLTALVNLGLFITNLIPKRKRNFYNDGKLLLLGYCPYSYEELNGLSGQIAEEMYDEDMKLEMLEVYSNPIVKPQTTSF